MMLLLKGNLKNRKVKHKFNHFHLIIKNNKDFKEIEELKVKILIMKCIQIQKRQIKFLVELSILIKVVCNYLYFKINETKMFAKLILFQKI